MDPIDNADVKGNIFRKTFLPMKLDNMQCFFNS